MSHRRSPMSSGQGIPDPIAHELEQQFLVEDFRKYDQLAMDARRHCMWIGFAGSTEQAGLTWANTDLPLRPRRRCDARLCPTGSAGYRGGVSAAAQVAKRQIGRRVVPLDLERAAVEPLPLAGFSSAFRSSVQSLTG